MDWCAAHTARMPWQVQQQQHASAPSSTFKAARLAADDVGVTRSAFLQRPSPSVSQPRQQRHATTSERCPACTRPSANAAKGSSDYLRKSVHRWSGQP